jgi:predicted alpha/beta hydrolase family esterase
VPGFTQATAVTSIAPSPLHGPERAARRALRDDDVCRWRPSVPVRLVAARGDRDVPFEHAEHCQQQLRSHGGDAANRGPGT